MNCKDMMQIPELTEVLKLKAGNIVLKVTNTASYEMNFTEEEIMERFARAEKSRTSEGNGLGLSIALISDSKS